MFGLFCCVMPILTWRQGELVLSIWSALVLFFSFFSNRQDNGKQSFSEESLHFLEFTLFNVSVFLGVVCVNALQIPSKIRGRDYTISFIHSWAKKKAATQ